jgi:hypothetical protein
MPADPTTAQAPAQTSPLRCVLARDGRALLAGALTTVGVQLGLYLLARLAGVPQMQAALATLAATVMWVTLAAPVLGASGADALAGLLRGGCIADASAVTLIVLWLACPEVTFPAAVKIYCVLAAVALSAVAVGRLARSPDRRYALAVTAALVMTVALASPLWIGGALRAAPDRAARGIAAAGVYVNPFYAVTAAIAAEARFVWHQAGVMYRITRIGDYADAPPARWYPCVLIHLAVAILLGAAAHLRHRRRAEDPRT